MKNIIYIPVILVMLSCNDALIENPKSLVVESFYNTEAEVETAIAAAYSPLRSGDVFGAIYLSLQECKSDQIGECRASWAPVSDFGKLDNTNVTRTSGTWVQFYRCIRNSNLVIGNVPNSKTLSDQKKNQYIGEAKFLRAFSYFHLVRNWGSVPIRTELNFDEYDLPRGSIDDIYELILSDAQFAEDNLPTTAISGRATNWTAKALLIEVYLTLGNYSDAATKAYDIINSGNYSLVHVEEAEDFELLYGPTVVGSPEVLFSVNYNENSGWAHPRYAHGVNVPYLGVSGYYVFYSDASKRNYTMWDDNDLRKQFNWYPWNTPLGELLMIKKFNDPGELVGRNDYPVYKYSEILLYYAEALAKSNDAVTVDAIDALNQVRRRAYGYNPNNKSPIDFADSNYSKEEFVNLVIRERGYETLGEGKRWLDLKRLGVEKQYIKDALEKEVSDVSLLWPIPDNEINFNNSITSADQNPGY